ncbi:MAG: phosphatidate cytidylyltransferase [Clostridia bacterium]|nr:phosphatidate cytidylyltransferase [Clostridia bacterium]
MKTRIITAVVAILGIFPFFWFSAPVEPTNILNYAFPLLISLISLVSVWELLHSLQMDKKYLVSTPFYLVAFLFPMLARVMRNDLQSYVRIAVFTILAVAIYLFAVIVFQLGRLDMGKISLVFMTSVYIIGANAGVIVLRDVPEYGRYLYLIPFLFSWVTDSFAYFTGRLFGKHKLIPQVSPKKTVEGAVGGFVCCALTTLLYGLIVERCFHVAPNYLVLGISGLVIGAVSQIGDLMMSALKRQQGIKDFGWMLPGHGGLLDRFDSSMAVSVLVLIVSTYFPFFG